MTAKDGFVPGPDTANTVEKFGAIVYTDIGNWHPVSTSGEYKTPLVPVALEMVSDAAADVHPDNGVGIGAHTVQIMGLKTAISLFPETEDIKLNGITAVALVDDWWRVYRMTVIQSGTYASSLGASHSSTIELREVVSGDIWVIITAENGFGLGQSEVGAFTIAKGQHAHLEKYDIEVSNTNKAGDVALFIREYADDIVTPYSGIMQIKKDHRNMGADSRIKRKAVKGEYLLHVDGPADIGFMCYGAAAMDLSVDFKLRCFNK